MQIEMHSNFQVLCRLWPELHVAVLLLPNSLGAHTACIVGPLAFWV